MWWRRAPDDAIDVELVSGMIRKPMSIDDKVDRLIRELLDGNGEEEADT
jgi:hypothetical protein